MIVGAELAKNIRRTGIPASRRGKPNPAYPVKIETGPTPERLAMAHDHFHIGDDRRGGKLYHFHDAPLDRLYSRLTREAKGLAEEGALRREYTALMKYKHHWAAAGKEATIASVDPNNIFSSNPSARAGMPMAGFQMDHDRQWRSAREELGHKPGIVVDNVVCAEWPLHIAGHSIGYDSPYRARLAATEILRDAGYRLAKLWGIG